MPHQIQIWNPLQQTSATNPTLSTLPSPANGGGLAVWNGKLRNVYNEQYRYLSADGKYQARYEP